MRGPEHSVAIRALVDSSSGSSSSHLHLCYSQPKNKGSTERSVPGKACSHTSFHCGLTAALDRGPGVGVFTLQRRDLRLGKGKEWAQSHTLI